MNDICIILHGAAMSSLELENDIIAYTKMNIKNIIVSTYSQSITNYIKDNYNIIENDKVGEHYIELDSKWTNYTFKFSYDISDTIFFKNSDNKLPTNRSIEFYKNPNNQQYNFGHWKYDYGNNTFAHILSTRRGILEAQKKYPNCKYYLKLRCDMFINNLDEILNELMHIINNNELKNELFLNKIILNNLGKNENLKRNWYLCDWLSFGKKEDIYKLYFFNKYNDIGTPDQCIHSSYIVEKLSDINDKIAINKYYYFYDFTKNITWRKYNHVNNCVKMSYKL